MRISDWSSDVCSSDLKSMNFGIYPMVSLVQAREKRNEARAILDEGKDHAIVKKLTIEANRKAAECTFKKIAKDWQEMFKSQCASDHADDVIPSLERGVIPSSVKITNADYKPPK